jgi:hypothetical protein
MVFGPGAWAPREKPVTNNTDLLNLMWFVTGFAPERGAQGETGQIESLWVLVITNDPSHDRQADQITAALAYAASTAR